MHAAHVQVSGARRVARDEPNLAAGRYTIVVDVQRAHEHPDDGFLAFRILADPRCGRVAGRGEQGRSAGQNQGRTDAFQR